MRYYITHRIGPMRQCQALSQFKLKLASKFPFWKKRMKVACSKSGGISRLSLSLSLSLSPRATQRALCSPLSCFVTSSRRPALFRPREVCDGNDEEAVKEARSVNVRRCSMPSKIRAKLGVGRDAACRARCNKMNHRSGATYLFEVSAIPAKALYQARNAAKRPNPPPAWMSVGSGAPSTRWR
jgi:hypothetical protein